MIAGVTQTATSTSSNQLTKLHRSLPTTANNILYF